MTQECVKPMCVQIWIQYEVFSVLMYGDLSYGPYQSYGQGLVPRCPDKRDLSVVLNLGPMERDDPSPSMRAIY